MGLEIEDWGVLVGITGFLFILVKSPCLDLGLAMALWAWFYFVKAKQAPGYTQALFDYFRSPRALLAELEIKHD